MRLGEASSPPELADLVWYVVRPRRAGAPAPAKTNACAVRPVRRSSPRHLSNLVRRSGLPALRGRRSATCVSGVHTSEAQGLQPQPASNPSWPSVKVKAAQKNATVASSSVSTWIVPGPIPRHTSNPARTFAPVGLHGLRLPRALFVAAPCPTQGIDIVFLVNLAWGCSICHFAH